MCCWDAAGVPPGRRRCAAGRPPVRPFPGLLSVTSTGGNSGVRRARSGAVRQLRPSVAGGDGARRAATGGPGSRLPRRHFQDLPRLGRRRARRWVARSSVVGGDLFPVRPEPLVRPPAGRCGHRSWVAVPPEFLVRALPIRLPGGPVIGRGWRVASRPAGARRPRVARPRAGAVRSSVVGGGLFLDPLELLVRALPIRLPGGAVIGRGWRLASRPAGAPRPSAARPPAGRPPRSTGAVGGAATVRPVAGRADRVARSAPPGLSRPR